MGVSAGVGILSLGAFHSRNTSEQQTTAKSNPSAKLPEQTEKVNQLAALLAPYQGGSLVGGSQLKNVSIDAFGMGVIMLQNLQGQVFRVDVCGRDPENSTVQPIAQTKHCALFLRNFGSGDTPTDESMGLSVMALADAIQNNESAKPALPLITKTEFWARSMRS